MGDRFAVKIAAAKIKCENPHCDIWFIPKRPWQRFHDPSCRWIAFKENIPKQEEEKHIVEFTKEEYEYILLVFQQNILHTDIQKSILYKLEKVK